MQEACKEFKYLTRLSISFHYKSFSNFILIRYFMRFSNGKYSGIWPVARPFHPMGRLIEEHETVLNCMIDQGVDSICIWASLSSF